MHETPSAARIPALSRPADAPPVIVADSDAARRNLELFDELDFEAWNGRDWDRFHELHADHVHVSGFGQTTDGIDDHLAWARGFVSQVPDAKVLAHPLQIAAGDWTVVVGSNSDGSKAATIARWESGQIVEEYLFVLMPGPAAPESQR
ncbi:MAG TPA: nuclear transport factor 2 family protein [Candidatus Thermoplasmatota archaeon]|nr:nuclear transport factor 2 family protein [Candidatus Thermoplasmatota archaeon]